MRLGILAGIVLLFNPVSASADDQSAWTTVPEFQLMRKLVDSTMPQYSDWAVEFRQSGRKPSPADWTVNLMAADLFLQVLVKMGERPDRARLREYLLFLGETVPREFDSIWLLIFLELSSNIDGKMGLEVDRILKEKGLMPLRERAMAKDEALK